MTHVWNTTMLLFVVIIAFSVKTAESEPTPSPAEIREQLHAIIAPCDRDEGLAPSLQDMEIFFAADPARVLDVLLELEQDPSACKRRFVFYLARRVVAKAHSPALTQQWFDHVIPALCAETKSETSAILSANAERLLKQGAELTEEARNQLRQHLATDQPNPEVIRLVGVVGLTDQIPRLKSLQMSDEEYTILADQDGAVSALGGYTGWMARVALARMGSREDLQFCIDKIESTRNMYVRLRILLPYYVYIRQPETIALLQQYLDSDEVLADGIENPRYALIALRLLRELLEDFPQEGGRERARAWMREQKSFRFKR